MHSFQRVLLSLYVYLSLTSPVGADDAANEDALHASLVEHALSVSSQLDLFDD